MIETIWKLVVLYIATQGGLTSESVTTVEGYPTEEACRATEEQLRATLRDPAIIFYESNCVPVKRMVTPDDNGRAM